LAEIHSQPNELTQRELCLNSTSAWCDNVNGDIGETQKKILERLKRDYYKNFFHSWVLLVCSLNSNRIRHWVGKGNASSLYEKDQILLSDCFQGFSFLMVGWDGINPGHNVIMGYSLRSALKLTCGMPSSSALLYICPYGK
jgi:hypothetical protein